MITRRDSALREVGTLIRGRAKNAAQLSKLLGIAPKTAKKRIEDPSTITLGEMWRLVDTRTITAEEARGAISFERRQR